jgi:hypothetical protein
VDRHVVPEDAAVPSKERWYAFSFGIALYEVDDCMARSAAWAARDKDSSARPKTVR